MQGLFFARVAPPKAERRTLEVPALVIGHDRDPIHPFSDSDELVAELPDARLVQASSILELRLQPERLTGRDRRASSTSAGSRSAVARRAAIEVA